MKNEIKEITEIITILQDCGRKSISRTEGVIVENEDIATALYEAGYRKQIETVKEFAEEIMDKSCRNCEHAFLETCKSCNPLPPNYTYENFELRKDITAEKHRADVAEEALNNAVESIHYMGEIRWK